jgi:AcrR family transcriptional regulator
MDDALDKALRVFWKRGYEGTSIAELTDKLGINKPSLYAAFGNKEQLFKKALGSYALGPVAFVMEVVNEPTARKVAESFLEKAAEALTSANNPKGCMIVQGALSCGEEAEGAREMLIKFRKGYEDLLAKRFEKAKQEGDLPDTIVAKDLAKFLAILHQGMSVQATSGATKEDLLAVSHIALKNWPTSS